MPGLCLDRLECHPGFTEPGEARVAHLVAGCVCQPGTGPGTIQHLIKSGDGQRSATGGALEDNEHVVVDRVAGAFSTQVGGHGSQYTSLAFTEELHDAGITGSIGTVGDALDNALMESTIGLYKTEVIEHEKPTGRSWSGRAEVEKATASWVHWFNTTRLHTSISDIPPVEYEEAHHNTTNSSDGYSRTAVA